MIKYDHTNNDILKACGINPKRKKLIDVVALKCMELSQERKLKRLSEMIEFVESAKGLTSREQLFLTARLGEIAGINQGKQGAMKTLIAGIMSAGVAMPKEKEEKKPHGLC